MTERECGYRLPCRLCHDDIAADTWDDMLLAIRDHGCDAVKLAQDGARLREVITEMRAERDNWFAEAMRAKSELAIGEHSSYADECLGRAAGMSTLIRAAERRLNP